VVQLRRPKVEADQIRIWICIEDPEQISPTGKCTSDIRFNLPKMLDGRERLPRKIQTIIAATPGKVSWTIKPEPGGFGACYANFCKRAQ
jgi:hypothetical protein